MMGEVRTALYGAPAVSRKEILRYAGAGEADDALDGMLDACASAARDALTYRVAYATYPITPTETGLDLGFALTPSRDLAKNLLGCERVLLFCATVGMAIDRLILREGVRSPAKALLLEAIGSAHAEALCDAFLRDAAEKYAGEGYLLRPRYSPGYGDLPLSLQTEVFRALSLPKTLGVSLNQSLLMTPRKTVTAIVGLCPARCPKEQT